MTDTPPLRAGDAIGQYELLQPLGEGAFAVVWKTRHRVLGSLHAVKLLHPQWAADARIRERFVAEGQILAQLRHPSLVAVTDIVLQPPHVGLVMDFVEGRSLADELGKRGRLDEPEVRPLMATLLDALTIIHEAGIVHRDLKPENILITAQGDPVLIDFGVAKIMDETQVQTGPRTATRMRARIGTPAYMSPEQIQSSAAIDARSDLFAMGVIAYELLTGHVPFDGEDITEQMYRISRGEHRGMEPLPPQWRAPIETALARHVIDRHQTAEAFRDALPGGRAWTPTPPPSRLSQDTVDLSALTAPAPQPHDRAPSPTPPPPRLASATPVPRVASVTPAFPPPSSAPMPAASAPAPASEPTGGGRSGRPLALMLLAMSAALGAGLLWSTLSADEAAEPAEQQELALTEEVVPPPEPEVPPEEPEPAIDVPEAVEEAPEAAEEPPETEAPTRPEPASRPKEAAAPKATTDADQLKAFRQRMARELQRCRKGGEPVRWDIEVRLDRSGDTTRVQARPETSRSVPSRLTECIERTLGNASAGELDKAVTTSFRFRL